MATDSAKFCRILTNLGIQKILFSKLLQNFAMKCGIIKIVMIEKINTHFMSLDKKEFRTTLVEDLPKTPHNDLHFLKPRMNC